MEDTAAAVVEGQTLPLPPHLQISHQKVQLLVMTKMITRTRTLLLRLLQALLLLLVELVMAEAVGARAVAASEAGVMVVSPAPLLTYFLTVSLPPLCLIRRQPLVEMTMTGVSTVAQGVKPYLEVALAH